MTASDETIVRTSGNIHVTADEQLILQRLFGRYAKVAVEAEFGMGLSGCRVFRVRPVAASGVAHSPALVKIGPINLIDKEWVAYETWVRNRLPPIAWVTSEPIVPSGSTWGGLQCELVGGGIFEVQSLSQYYRNAGVEDVLWVLQKRLFPVMSRSWWLVNRTDSSFQLESDYDQILPVNLLISARKPSSKLPSAAMTLATGSRLSTAGRQCVSGVR